MTTQMNPFEGMSKDQQRQPVSGSTNGALNTSNMTIDTFMAAIRRLESGSYQGNYAAVGRMVRGDRAIGAYQIMSRYWDKWAAAAGIAGADWRDPVAQDHVARHVMSKYYERFKNWDLVALAWYAGGSTAQKVLDRGYAGPQSINNPGIRQYVEEVSQYATEAQAKDILPKQGYGPIPTMSQSASGWIFPVAGAATWSRGSWMPNEKTHRDRFHPAIDIYAEAGTPIVSPISGVVQQTKKTNIGGNTVRVLGDDGYTYYFAHMQDAAVVGAGQRINSGQFLGYVGNTGSASTTDPHLHFSMVDDRKREVNPISWLEAAVMGGGAMAQGYTMDDFGAQKPEGIELRPLGQEAPTKQGALTQLLGTLADKVAGGSRDPSLWRKYGEMSQDDYESTTLETP